MRELHSMKQWLLAYLTFSRKERWGVVVLVILVLMIWLLPRFFGREDVVDDELLLRADSILASTASTPRVADSLFMFDPNRASEQEWMQLGLTERAAQTVRNYLSKGGRFRKPADLLKIYGIHPETANRLLPYVQIEASSHQSREMINRGYSAQRLDSRSGQYAPAYRPRADPPPSIYRNGNTGTGSGYKRKGLLELNEADSVALEALPGIGAKLSARILKFRESCGGFYRVEQLAGVYGLSDSVYMIIAPMFRVDDARVRKISINTISADSLDRHPYVQRHEAKAIEKYRRQHGLFRDTADLAKVHALGPEWLMKMAPYLDFKQ